MNSGSSREREAMHLRRCLAFLEAKWSFHMFAEHIRGVHNGVADALSRNKCELAKMLYPQAEAKPVTIPETMLQVLVERREDWKSPNWMKLWQITSGFSTGY